MQETRQPAQRTRFSGGRLRALRLSQRLTQPELGALVGVANTSICRWEMGRSVPTGIGVARICDALRCSPSALYDQVQR